MLWLLEDSDESCIVAEGECGVAGKMIDYLYLTKLGIVDGSLTGSADCCVDYVCMERYLITDWLFYIVRTLMFWNICNLVLCCRFRHFH